MNEFDFDVIWKNAWFIFRDGMSFTLLLTAVAGSLGLALGIGLAVLRTWGNRFLKTGATLYVNTFRSLPLVLVIFWFFFLVPFLVQWATGSSRPVPVGAVWSAMITFTLFEAAYFCEIVRSGINGIPAGQSQAALALGMSGRTAFVNVVLPQALRNMLPVLLTQLIILFQDTSLVYVINIIDFVGAANKIAQRDGRLMEVYIFTAVVYFVICFGVSSIVKTYQTRVMATGSASGH
ncbi:amino acid ABC transporter permease [Sinorhizobium fredii]|uniref:amino acid ABC transporter permease n=1 Tax=Rhizobium fredii TaxID=380 RepID=UPI003517C09C